METVTGTQFGDSVCGNTENKVEQVGWGVCKARFEVSWVFFVNNGVQAIVSNIFLRNVSFVRNRQIECIR